MATRDLQKLDHQVARRVVERLERAAQNPDHYVTRLVGSDEYKLRVGEYRLLAALSHSHGTITVERVDQRSRIYQR